MGNERLDRHWRERGLAAYSTEALLGTLRHYGATVDEEQLRRVSSEEQVWALENRWTREWKGTGPFKELPRAAARELWKRLGLPEAPPPAELEKPAVPEAPFLGPLAKAPLDEKLVLAREAAAQPDFDVDLAFELSMHLAEVLEEAGRFAELEGVLDAWKEHAPEVHDAEPWVLAWRVALALRLPGKDVGAALATLAERAPRDSILQARAEWCLYRGLVKQTHPALLRAWEETSHESLLPAALEQRGTRAILTALDAALLEEPELPPERLREKLAPFEELRPNSRWIHEALTRRTGREPWRGTREGLAGMRRGERRQEQWALMMAFEWELLTRWGWPRGRTQLIHPELGWLLPEGPLKGVPRRGQEARSTNLLLPARDTLEEWASEGSERRYLHPHVHAATALALRPWGGFLHGLGLMEDAELAGWNDLLRQVLARLPEWLADDADDPALADEVREGLSSTPA
ncbi:hypothetical protein [Archangium violaceum]|uniref:Uncharacterized protein n=1 Tax=Archangium violaceum Cb vi76 TaxID=1406225 RepID=A0A084SX01_9BACT|nr:hypothetical protein [Archangium violaceum]KFA92986.1 hypothetical protein Q664_11915 [Archangium violaceum Cb vi76]